jgi:type IV secretory pathway VirB2 component (pilin)
MERVQAFARFVLESLAALNVVVVIIVGGLSVMSGRLGWPEAIGVPHGHARAPRAP